jgi:hypothetical protein
MMRETHTNTSMRNALVVLMFLKAELLGNVKDLVDDAMHVDALEVASLLLLEGVQVDDDGVEAIFLALHEREISDIKPKARSIEKGSQTHRYDLAHDSLGEHLEMRRALDRLDKVEPTAHRRRERTARRFAHEV